MSWSGSTPRITSKKYRRSSAEWGDPPGAAVEMARARLRYHGRMHVPSLVLVVVSAAGVAAGCRTDDPRPVDITPAYCARLERLRLEVDARFVQAEGRLPRSEPVPAETGAGAPPQQPDGAPAAPSLPDVIACVEALHDASKAAVMVGQFSAVAHVVGDIQRIAGFESSAYKQLDTTLSAAEVDIYAPHAWCIAGEIVRVKVHLSGWRDQFLARIAEATAQCTAGADASTAK